MAKRTCTATTVRGKPCQAAPLKGTDRCGAHPLSPASPRFGSPEQASQAGQLGGRPRRPREIELVQEVADEYRDEMRLVLIEGLQAQRGIVVGDGESARVEFVADHSQRLRTFQEIQDRLHGKPRTTLDATLDQRNLTVNVDVADSETRGLIADFLRRRPALDGSEPG